jgi:outer membrane protein with beta-barrel domain
MRVPVIGLALFLSSGVATATAQQRQFGGKIGLTIATIVSDSADQDGVYSRKTSLGGGGFVVPLNGHLALQIEALFTPKGGKLPSEENVSTALLLDYFEIPLLGRITAARSSSRSVYVFGGPSAGLRINAKYRVASSGTVGSSGFADDISSEVERFELGMIAGGGLDAGRHLDIDARYFWGLTDVNRDASDGNHLRNRAFTVLAGLRF